MLSFLRKWKMREEWKPVVVCFALAFVSACSGKSDGDLMHKGETATAMTAPNPSDLSPKILTDAEVAAYQAKTRAAAADVYVSTIQPLRHSFFNAGMLLDATKQGTQRDELLRLYNQAVLDFAKIAKTDEEKASLAKVLDEYEDMVTLGCDKRTYLGGCRLVDGFREASNSWDVWMLILDRGTDDIARTEKRLRLGFKLLNDREASKVQLRYLQEAPRIEADIEAKDDKEREELHYNRIERILRNSEPIKASAEYAGYLRYLLEADQTTLKKGRKQQVRQLVMIAKADGNLLAEPWFLKGLAAAAKKSADGYATRLALVSARGGSALKNFDLEPVAGDDPLLLLVDNVFNSIWSPSTAINLWRKTNPKAADKERIKKLFVDYVRTMVLAMVVESNREMGEFYADPSQFQSSEIHVKAYQMSLNLKGRWLDVYNRVDRLRDFATMVLGNNEELSKLRIDQASLNETVAYLVSYPHMMIMTYQMVKFNFQLRGMFSSVDATFLVSAFFEGKFGESWFDYTQARRGIRSFNPTELLYVIQYALKTDAFATMGIDPDDFIRTITGELMKSKLVTSKNTAEYGLYELIEMAAAPARGFAEPFEEAQRFCREERVADAARANRDAFAAAAIPRSYQLEVSAEHVYNGFLQNTNFGNLVFGTFNNKRDVPKVDPLYHGLDFLSTTMEEGIDQIRFGLGESVNYSRDIIAIYRRHLETSLKGQGREAEIEARIAKVSEPLAAIQHDLRRFYTLVYKRMREFVFPCHDYFIRKEFDIQNDVIRYEFEHLKQAYRDFHRLKALAAAGPLEASEEAKAIQARYAVRGLESQGYRGFDRFQLEQGVYAAYRFDSVFRMQRYLKEGLVTETARLAPINPSITITIPQGGIRGMEQFTNARPVLMNVAEAKSAEEFALKYIKVMRSTKHVEGGEFVNFHQRATWTLNIQRSLPNILVALLKTGEVEVYPADRADCLTQKALADCKPQKTQLSEQETVGGMYRVFDIISGTPEDRAVMGLLGLKQRMQVTSFPTEDGKNYYMDQGYGLMFHPHTRAPLGFFDFMYILMTNLRVGWYKLVPWDPPIIGAKGLQTPIMASIPRAEQLYKVRADERLFLYEPDLELGDLLSRQYAKRVEQEFGGPKLIATIAKHSEEADRRNNFDRRYFMYNSTGDTMGGNYLTYRLVDDEETREREFHKSTRFLFKNFRLPQE